MKYFAAIILCSVNLICNSQTLKNDLWSFTSSCKGSLINGYQESNDALPSTPQDYCDNYIDDTKNGYLYIEGSWPTCGCGCEVEIGGYKRSNGEYIFLSFNKWSCENYTYLKSNIPLDSLLPEKFSLETFGANGFNDSLNYFFLDVNIPRTGTDTRIKLELYPVGIVSHGNSGVAFKEERPTVIYGNISYLLDGLNELEYYIVTHEKTAELSEENKAKLIKKLNDRDGSFVWDDFLESMSYINRIYKAYNSIENTEIVLSWNREIGRFEIKSKTSPPKRVSLEQFLSLVKFYSPSC